MWLLTCLHKVGLLQASVHLWCKALGTTGSLRERRNVIRTAATEYTLPTGGDKEDANNNKV